MLSSLYLYNPDCLNRNPKSNVSHICLKEKLARTMKHRSVSIPTNSVDADRRGIRGVDQQKNYDIYRHSLAEPAKPQSIANQNRKV